MHRFTISIDDELAAEFDRLIANRGYENRSEAVRDLVRAALDSDRLAQPQASWCAATTSYVYDHQDQTVSARLRALQHAHHDVVVSCLNTHLDHHSCLETVILKGRTPAVQSCAQELIALRGVRHGHIAWLPLAEAGPSHTHAHGGSGPHKHLRPLN